MQMLRNAAFTLVVSGAILLFAIGGVLGEARIGQKRVMQEIQGRISIYAAISFRCIEIECDEEMQQLVVASTDADLQHYKELEAEVSENWFVGSWNIAISSFLTRDSVTRSLRSAEQLRLIFKKRDCGIDGKICRKQFGKTTSETMTPR